MTDLERLLMDAPPWARELIDAHLKEDAELIEELTRLRALDPYQAQAELARLRDFYGAGEYDAFEAELARLREALEEIANPDQTYESGNPDMELPSDIARNALKETT